LGGTEMKKRDYKFDEKSKKTERKVSDKALKEIAGGYVRKTR